MLIDPKNHPICEVCNHPLWSPDAFVDVKKDDQGSYIVCKVCGNKYYTNKNKEGGIANAN